MSQTKLMATSLDLNEREKKNTQQRDEKPIAMKQPLCTHYTEAKIKIIDYNSVQLIYSNKFKKNKSLLSERKRASERASEQGRDRVWAQRT